MYTHTVTQIIIIIDLTFKVSLLSARCQRISSSNRKSNIDTPIQRVLLPRRISETLSLYHRATTFPISDSILADNAPRWRNDDDGDTHLPPPCGRSTHFSHERERASLTFSLSLSPYRSHHSLSLSLSLPRMSLLFGWWIEDSLVGGWSFKREEVNRTLATRDAIHSRRVTAPTPFENESSSSVMTTLSARRPSRDALAWPTHGVTVVAQLTRRGRRHNGTSATRNPERTRGREAGEVPATRVSATHIFHSRKCKERERTKRAHASARRLTRANFSRLDASSRAVTSRARFARVLRHRTRARARVCSARVLACEKLAPSDEMRERHRCLITDERWKY